MKNGDLFGAGGAQVLAQQGLSLCVEMATALLHYFLDVAIGLRLRVDSVDAQTGNLSRERHRKMGCGISRAEVDGMTALHQTEGEGGGDRGLADAALSHDHDQAPSVRRQKVDQPIECWNVAGKRHGRSGRCRSPSCPRRAEQGAQRAYSQHVEGAERNIVPRQRLERRRKIGERPLPQVFQRRSSRVRSVAGPEHAVHNQSLVRETERAKLRRGSRRLGEGGGFRSSYEDDGRRFRIAECRHRHSEARFLHLEPGMRSQAGGAFIIDLEKTTPRLG